MNNLTKALPLCAAAAIAGSVFFADAVNADTPSAAGPQLFEVTITNLTATQIISAPIVTSHSDATRMFAPGMAASMELQALAEDGDNSSLAMSMGADIEVLDVVTYPGNILPGSSMTMNVTMDAFHRTLSMAGMLVTTNDAFFGIDGVTMGNGVDSAVFFAPVFDSGTEANSEDGMYIPGPPFGNGGSHDPAMAEGFIHLSSGIHGGSSLAPAAWDWGSSAARIEVRRL